MQAPASTHHSHIHRRAALGAGLALFSPWGAPLAQAQNPGFADESWQDTRRQRAVPVRIRWPQAAAPAAGWPVVIYSHGLGGSRDGGDVWGNAWANAGLVVVHLQHTGSDIDAARSVASSFHNTAALRTLGGAEQLLARLQDVVFALDEMARRKTIDKAWRFVNLDAVGMAGHSSGAHTALGMGGQSYPHRAAINELRISALIALSPNLPAQGNAAHAYAGVTRPTLCITGTLDGEVLNNGATPDKRAAVFGALPAGKKALLLLKDADHMTFAGVTGPAASILPRAAIAEQLQPQHHALVSSITSDWWRTHLVGLGQAAVQQLRPDGLGAQDVWREG